METQEIYRGRLIDHLQLVVRDLEASKKFYAAAFEALKIPMGGTGPDYFWTDELFISSKESQAAQNQLTGRTHLAFQASSQKMVDHFHEITIKAGGKDNGKPGERPYHPGYYACFVTDPDGNNIEAVYHGPAKRSAEAIKIEWT